MIHGQKIEDLAPLLFALVAKRRANKRTVLETLTDNTWIGNLQGALSVGILAKFLNLWVILSQVVLQPQSEDSTAKSAYEGLFQGSVFGEPGLLTNITFSCGWSRTISAGLQIVLLSGVNSITRNVCCVIRKRKPSITCWFLVSSLGNTGFSSYKKFGPQILAPQPAEPSFEVWWS